MEKWPCGSQKVESVEQLRRKQRVVPRGYLRQGVQRGVGLNNEEVIVTSAGAVSVGWWRWSPNAEVNRGWRV